MTTVKKFMTNEQYETREKRNKKENRGIEIKRSNLLFRGFNKSSKLTYRTRSGKIYKHPLQYSKLVKSSKLLDIISGSFDPIEPWCKVYAAFNAHFECANGVIREKRFMKLFRLKNISKSSRARNSGRRRVDYFEPVYVFTRVFARE